MFPGKTDASEPSVQIRFERRIVRVKLDGETAVPSPSLERRPGPNDVVAEPKLDGAIGKRELG
ncbi:MAG TPA: hypothetical protein VF992_01985 [Thermoplasmata archaeon]